MGDDPRERYFRILSFFFCSLFLPAIEISPSGVPDPEFGADTIASAARRNTGARQARRVFCPDFSRLESLEFREMSQ